MLERINLEIAAGAFVSIVGPSGCGKSTSCAWCWGTGSAWGAAAQPRRDRPRLGGGGLHGGFLAASGPTSFLRLAGIPFTTTSADGATLRLLRVEAEVVADVGAVTPPLGGGPFRYDPLPTRLVSRRLLRFVYFDWAGLRPLAFAPVRQAAREAGAPD